LKVKIFFENHTLSIRRTAEARQRYQEYLDRFPWGKHAQEALAALERLGAV
jgi:hypothetical protein